MVTEAVPFADESALQTMYQRVTQKPRSPKLANEDLPDYLEAVIMRCLEKDPADRYQHAREVWQDLEASRPPKPKLPAGIKKRIGYPRLSRRWLAPTAVGLLLALGLGVAPVRQGVARLWHSIAGTAPTKQTYIALLPLRVVGAESALK